ncbi:MAG: response regulator [Magnetococcales bacterium]|nr:response regulator [Magnetococcales bacterium]
MDTKRVPYTSEYKTLIKTMLLAKYQSKKIDLILVSDNNAFDFMKEFGEELFPGVPVVFCGVNNFQDAWIKDLPNFTGLAEIFDSHATLSSALKINPNIRQVLILNDYLPTGQAWSNTIKEQIDDFKNSLEITYAKDMPFDELLETVSNLPADSIILFGVYFRDSLGQYYEPWQSATKLSQHSSVPIYGLLDLYINHGIIGGKLISGYHQGQGAARIALRILAGEDPTNIRVEKTDINKLIFDYKLLKRFNISTDQLPSASIIINQPETFLKKYAQYIWGTITVFIMLVIMVIVLLLNISRRKQVENSLRISEERFSLAMQGINDGLWDWNLETNEIYLSPVWKTMLGYKDDELENHVDVWKSNIHPDDIGREKQTVDEYLSGKLDRYEIELSMRHKNGYYLPILSRGLAVRNETGKPIRLIGTNIDITVQKQLEEKLKFERKRIELLLEAIPVWVYVLAPDYSIKWYNKHFLEQFGDPTGKPCYTAIQGYDQPCQRCPTFEVFETKIMKSWEHTDHSTGRTSIVYDSFFIDSDGSPLVLEMGIDITEQRNTEKLRHAKEVAEQANEAKSQFLASMSHDIRTPMNAILGMGEMLAESGLNEEQRHYIDIINNSGNGLLALINDILDLSKIEAGQLKLESIPFNPKELAQHSIDTLKTNALNQGIGMIVNIEDSIPEQIIGDPTRIRQILLNLLSNAVKFSFRGKVVLSVVKTEAGLIQFSISDSGIGIAANKLKTIFQPFKQADSSTTRRFGGTGLGLSICEKLVNKMDGNIWVESKLNEGSTFHFAIPCQKTAVDKKPQLPDGNTNQIEQEKNTTGLSILLADDVEENCMVLQSFLKETPYQLTTVENGALALEKYKNGKFDLILMDIHMPIMDGYEATMEIRSWEKSQNLTPVSILALTANAMKEDIERTHQVGCNLHMSKPIRKQLLIDTIKKFI